VDAEELEMLVREAFEDLLFGTLFHYSPPLKVDEKYLVVTRLLVELSAIMGLSGRLGAKINGLRSSLKDYVEVMLFRR